jgi:tetratricopeptide (TPR) repeat protein
MRTIRRVLLCLVPTAALALSGCAPKDGAAWQEELRGTPVLQKAARAFLTGQIYDRATLALRDGNEAALQSAQDDLQIVAPQLAAEQAVRSAALLDDRAQGEKDATRASALRERAAKKYREALEIEPNFDSRDPDLLNALGYFLADRGTNTSDFQTAEKLTRRSLEIWNDLVKDAEDTALPGTNQLLAVRRFLRANTRDSLAWALFRQGKYPAAQKAQESAVDEAARTAPLLKQKVPADLYYHLGEILRAQGKLPQAAAQYRKALSVEPEHKLAARALKLLPPALRQPAPQTKVQPAPETQPTPNAEPQQGQGTLTT